MNKIIGIGLSKTGTSSLVDALIQLGFTTTHRNELSHLETHDAAAELIFAARYRELDRQYPGSKFILTTRDKATWLESSARWFAEPKDLHWRREFFGTDRYDEPTWSQVWDRHHEEVRGYFQQRPEDLLILHLCDGEGWHPLCKFLELPTPHIPFPHLRPVRGGRNRNELTGAPI